MACCPQWNMPSQVGEMAAMSGTCPEGRAVELGGGGAVRAVTVVQHASPRLVTYLLVEQ